MMQELQKMYQHISVPPTLKEDILTYCRSAQEKRKPFIVRYAKPIAAIAACAAALVVTLAATGNLFEERARFPVGGPESSTPAGVGSQTELAPESVSTTRTYSTTIPAISTSTTTRLEGIGGDQDSCRKHVMFYHCFDGRLIDYVGSDKVDAYVKEKGWYNTYHLTREEREEFNVVNFIKHFGITKEELITAMGWSDMLDEKPDVEEIGIGYYNDQYTYREMADALYSGDQEQIDKVFYLEIIVVPTSVVTTIATETITEPTGNVSVLKPINGTTSTSGAYNPK